MKNINPILTQKQRVLKLLREFSELKPRILGYTERISELRQLGYIITNHREINNPKRTYYTLDN